MWVEDFDVPLGAIVTWGEEKSIIMNQDRAFLAIFIQGNVVNVSTVGMGQVNVSPDQELYHTPSTITLTAVPAEDWYFDHWEGDLTGNLNPASLEFNFEDFYVTAIFVDDYFDLALSVNDVNAGSVGTSPDPGPQGYGSGTVLSLTATPNPGWRFDHWTGDVTGSTNPAAVTMDANKSVTAVFVEDYYNLSTFVSDTNGGTVAASPGPAPQGYASGTAVTISATANPRWRFDHWEGALTGSTNPDTITMDSDKTVTAVFVQEFTLTTTIQGSGGIEQSLAGNVFVQGTQVTLTAVANESWRFDHWEGAVTGSDNPVNVLMDANKEVQAVFTPQFTLTVNIVGTGTVSPGSGVYDAGSLINLTATPTGQDVYFVEWQGDLAGSSNPVALNLDSDKTVTAVFGKMYQVNTYTEGNGTVSPESGLFLEGTEIEVSATPDPNWGFDEWIGDLPGAVDAEAPSFVVTVDGPMEFTALFVERPGQTDIDMVGDLGYFVTVIGESATVETFDRNGIDYDIAFNRLYVGNGVPDAVELYLLEKVLKTYGLSFTYKSGISHDVVWDAWTANLAQAAIDLDGHDPRVIRVVAGYMTIGDFDTVESIRHIVETALSPATLDPIDYDLTAQRHLYLRRDADNDGITNEMEWKAASPDGSLEDLQSFGGASLDGEPPADPPDPPEPGGCDNATCLDQRYFDVTSVAPLNYPVEIGNSTVIAVPFGQGIVIGTGWSAKAIPDSAGGWGFDKWQVKYPTSQKSFGRWGRELAVADALRANLDLRAEFVRYYLGLPDDTQDFTIDVQGHGGAFESADAQGNRIVYGPPGSSVTLTAHITDPAKTYLWNVNLGPSDPLFKISWETSVHIPLLSGQSLNTHGYARPVYMTASPPETKRIYVSRSGNGIALGAQAYGNGGAFQNSFVCDARSFVEFRAIPDPGWEFVEWQFDGPSPFTRTTPYVYQQGAQNIDRATAIFRPKVECTLDIEVENAGCSFPHCSGFVNVTGGVAKRYYEPSEQPVQLEAVPAPNCVFLGWEGTFLDATTQNPLTLNVAQYGVNRTVKAVFEYKPVVQIQSVEFAGAGAVVPLNWDDDGNWTDDPFNSEGVPIEPPHWERVGTTITDKPVCVIKETSPGITVELSSAAACPAPTGTQLLRCEWVIDGSTILTYEAEITLTDQPQTVNLATQDTLPNKILMAATYTRWSLSIDSGNKWFDLHAPCFHSVYIIYGQPYAGPQDSDGAPNNIGDWPWCYDFSFTMTVRRLALLTLGGYGKIARKDIAQGVAEAVYDLNSPAIAGDLTNIPVWKRLDPVNSYRTYQNIRMLDCYAGKILASGGLLMLGIPREHIKARSQIPNTQGCVAQASTDSNSGPNYWSDVTDQEYPLAWCNGGWLCPGPSSLPNPHPAHGSVGQPAATAEDKTWSLCWAENFSPAENFLKIQNDDGVWYYVTVVAPLPEPIVGDSTHTSEADKAARYMLMRTVNPKGEQYWYQDPHTVEAASMPVP